MESLLILLPERSRDRVEVVIHVLVGIFGAAMAYNGWVLGQSVMHYKIPNLSLTEGARYVPLVISGLLIVLFSVEHVLALLRGEEVEPAWH
jgi:TRAP-type C4-dicarboxylate transport system permease small subunit